MVHIILVSCVVGKKAECRFFKLYIIGKTHSLFLLNCFSIFCDSAWDKIILCIIEFLFSRLCLLWLAFVPCFLHSEILYSYFSCENVFHQGFLSFLYCPNLLCSFFYHCLHFFLQTYLVDWCMPIFVNHNSHLLPLQFPHWPFLGINKHNIFSLKQHFSHQRCPCKHQWDDSTIYPNVTIQMIGLGSSIENVPSRCYYYGHDTYSDTSFGMGGYCSDTTGDIIASSLNKDLNLQMIGE